MPFHISTHTFSLTSYTTFHYHLHPYILHPYNLYKYTLLTTHFPYIHISQILNEFVHTYSLLLFLTLSSFLFSLPYTLQPFISSLILTLADSSFSIILIFLFVLFFPILIILFSISLTSNKQNYYHGKDKRIIFQEATCVRGASRGGGSLSNLQG